MNVSDAEFERRKRALRYALTYGVTLGFDIFPIRAGMKGKPVVKWKDGATSDKDQILAWWGRQFVGANIGVATGARSGFFVVDEDPRHGGDKTLAALERKHGKLPDTARSHTPNGGHHFLFRQPAGLYVQNHTGGDGKDPSWPYAGLDVRGDGGMIVVPPSYRSDCDDREYEWEIEPNVLADPPSWLIDLLGVTSASDGGGGKPSKPPLSDEQLIAIMQGYGEGSRHEVRNKILGHLASHGVRQSVAEQFCLIWERASAFEQKRKPTDTKTIIKKVAAIYAAHAKERKPTRWYVSEEEALTAPLATASDEEALTAPLTPSRPL